MNNKRFKRDGWVQMPEFPIDESKDIPKIEKKNFNNIDIIKLKKYLKEKKKIERNDKK